jgi:hypothetical protein
MHHDRYGKILLVGLTILGFNPITAIATRPNPAQAELIPVELSNQERGNLPPQAEIILVPVERQRDPVNLPTLPELSPPPQTDQAPADQILERPTSRDRQPSLDQKTSYSGTWQGRVIQKGIDAPPYLVVINFEAANPIADFAVGDRLAQIDYPDLQCGGHLTVIEVRGDRLRAKEQISYGQRQCVDGGLVSLQMNDQNQTGSLAYDWTYAANPTESIVNGRLSRTDRP